MKPEQIAKIVHEANRSYCLAIGEDGSVKPPWEEFDRKEMVIEGVMFAMDNPDATPEQSHEGWLLGMESEGWVYGEVQDGEEKTHPCIMPYDELPLEQKVKDYLFTTLVRELAAIEPETVEVEKPVMVDGMPGYVAVKYIGRRPAFTDKIYNTGIEWKQDEVKLLPDDKAKLFLKHPDVFQKVEVTDDDDIEKANIDPGKQEDEAYEETQIAIQQIEAMGRKAQIVEYIEKIVPGYKHELKDTDKLQEYRDLAVRLVNQYGIPQ